MYEARSAEDIRIYKFIVIEFFLQLKIHKIGTYIPIFHIEKCNFIFSMVYNYHKTLAISWLKPAYCASIKNNSRFVDPNKQ